MSVYDPIEIGDPDLWIPSPELEALLDNGLRGISLRDLPLRTRSKVVKTEVCKALGYPVPKIFRKTRPRFLGQLLDTYSQKSNNLQIWNEDLAPTRRYAIIRVSETDRISRVRVVTGDALALLDTTGTLTQKYQARCVPGEAKTELVTEEDTFSLRRFVSRSVDLSSSVRPVDHPTAGTLLTIRGIFNRLSRLVGTTFRDLGIDQERNRGGELHRLVCLALGYRMYEDDGQFPDIRHQLLEIKLQTSPTIDLGLVTPDSTNALDVPQIHGEQIRHCDARYAIFYGKTDGTLVTLSNLYLTTGEAFFSRFPRFGGRVLNKKIQIPLPSHFFDA